MVQVQKLIACNCILRLAKFTKVACRLIVQRKLLLLHHVIWLFIDCVSSTIKRFSILALILNACICLHTIIVNVSKPITITYTEPHVVSTIRSYSPLLFNKSIFCWHHNPGWFLECLHGKLETFGGCWSGIFSKLDAFEMPNCSVEAPKALVTVLNFVTVCLQTHSYERICWSETKFNMHTTLLSVYLVLLLPVITFLQCGVYLTVSEVTLCRPS